MNGGNQTIISQKTFDMLMLRILETIIEGAKSESLEATEQSWWADLIAFFQQIYRRNST